MKHILVAVERGAIVRVGERWGVVCQGPPGTKAPYGTRCVDFWDGGMEYVRDITEVEVAPNKRAAA